MEVGEHRRRPGRAYLSAPCVYAGRCCTLARVRAWMAERGVIKVVNFIRARIWIRFRVYARRPETRRRVGKQSSVPLFRGTRGGRIQHGVRPAAVIMPRDTGSIRRQL